MADLILLSGGVDSASVLYERAVDTTRTVHALHVQLIHLQKADSERAAARKIAVWITTNVRPIDYHEFIFGGPVCGDGGFGLLGAMAATHIGKFPYIDTIIQGTNADEDQTPDSHRRNERFARIVEVVTDGLAPAPKIIQPHANVPKADSFWRMPKELRDLTTSCSRPVKDGETWSPCGGCERCQILNKIKESR